MMKEEFTKLTGIFPSTSLYSHIEAAYMDFSGDKAEFCKAYKKNADGLAEKIQHAADMQAFNAQTEAEKEAKKLEARIAELEKALEREQEWKPYTDTDSVRQEKYEKLAGDRYTEHMSDEKAKDVLFDWYGFAKEKVKIMHSAPVYEANRHGHLREIGTVDRSPLYNATDWNYIRFSCGLMSYELHDGDLRFL